MGGSVEQAIMGGSVEAGDNGWMEVGDNGWVDGGRR